MEHDRRSKYGQTELQLSDICQIYKQYLLEIMQFSTGLKKNQYPCVEVLSQIHSFQSAKMSFKWIRDVNLGPDTCKQLQEKLSRIPRYRLLFKLCVQHLVPGKLLQNFCLSILYIQCFNFQVRETVFSPLDVNPMDESLKTDCCPVKLRVSSDDT